MRDGRGKEAGRRRAGASGPLPSVSPPWAQGLGLSETPIPAFPDERLLTSTPHDSPLLTEAAIEQRGVTALTGPRLEKASAPRLPRG